MSDLIERLHKVESAYGVEGETVTNCFRNPDGPEAADEIERLRDALQRCAAYLDYSANCPSDKAMASMARKALAGTAAHCTHWWTNAPKPADVECKVCGVKRTADNQSEERK